MDVEIKNGPVFASLFVKMGEGDSITAESDAMASMTANVGMKTKFNGGFIKGLFKKFFGKESLFVNTFSSDDGNTADMVLTQAFPGDISCLSLDGNTVFLQPGAYIASEADVKLGLGWAGFASFIGGEGLFRLKVSGTGRIWFGGYGGIYEREITDEYVVDTGHLIGYDPSISLKVGMAGGIFSSFFSGEGLVTRVKGPGKIYLQSRNIDGLASWTNGHI